MTQKKFSIITLFLISSPVWADSLFNYGTEVDFNSRYVWRGLALSENPVVQPSAWISVKNFTFNLWANMDLTNEADRKRFNELDYTVSFEKEWKKFDFEPSFVVYEYPNQSLSPTTGEMALKGTYSFEPFALYTNQIFDLIRYRGSYFGEFGVSYAHEWNDKFSLESDISMGIGSAKFNETYLSTSTGALNVFTTDLALTYAPVSHVSFKPHIQLTALVDGQLRSQVDDPTIVAGGLAFDTEW